MSQNSSALPKQGTRERLLETSIDLISAQSYASVSVDDICEKAGVRKGSFYHFFCSKSELAIAAFERHWEESRAALDAIFSAQIPPLQRISDYCDYIYRQQLEKLKETGKVCGCPFASVGAELSTLDENIRKKTQEMTDRNCRYLESAVIDAVNRRLIPEVNARQMSEDIYSFVLGSLMSAKISNNPEGLRRLEAGILRLLGLVKS